VNLEFVHHLLELIGVSFILLGLWLAILSMLDNISWFASGSLVKKKN